ncbi:hypothetical protein ABZP36_024756 [Zizania latifolia]
MDSRSVHVRRAAACSLQVAELPQLGRKEPRSFARGRGRPPGAGAVSTRTCRTGTDRLGIRPPVRNASIVQNLGSNPPFPLPELTRIHRLGQLASQASRGARYSIRVAWIELLGPRRCVYMWQRRWLAGQPTWQVSELRNGSTPASGPVWRAGRLATPWVCHVM